MTTSLLLPRRQPQPFAAVGAWRPPAWRIQRLDVVDSTNDIAGCEPAWTAVIAERQRRGRGRYQRQWVSDAGGLWLSAVLPTPGPAAAWSVLPLAAGWAVREALGELGVSDLRLRWPNDIMVGRAKLAGILVERYHPGTVVVGIGLNLRNAPEVHAPELRGQVARLVDLLTTPCRDEVVIAHLLNQLARAQHILATDGLCRLLPALNDAWTGARVSIKRHNQADPLIGRLVAVDAQGGLVLHGDLGQRHQLSPLDVESLRELG